MSGFFSQQGALSSLGYLTGQSTSLASEWAAKTASGDPNPMTTYLMLLSTSPSSTQTDMATVASFECTGTGYARQSVPWAAPDATTQSVWNGLLTQFGPFTDSGGLNLPVAGAALATRQTGTSGLCLMVWGLASPITTAQNQVLQIAATQLAMGIT